MEKNKLLWLYVIIASFLSLVGGANFTFLNVILAALILLVSIYFSENNKRFFQKINRTYLPILLVLILCLFNGMVHFLTDSKDFYVLFLLQVFWGILGVAVYIIRKLMLKNDSDFLKGFLQWYLSLFIMILMERLLNGIKFLDVNFDIFHFIIAIFIWKLIDVFLLKISDKKMEM